MNATRSEAALQASGRRIDHLIANDVAATADLLDPGLIYIHGTGQVHDKARLLQFFERELRVINIDRRLQAAVGDGELTCLAFVQVMRAQLRHAPETMIEIRSHFCEIWRRSDGAWRLLHAQSTALTGPGASSNDAP